MMVAMWREELGGEEVRAVRLGLEGCDDGVTAKRAEEKVSDEAIMVA